MTAKIWNVSVLQRSLAPDWRVVSMENCSLSRPGAGRVGRKEGEGKGEKGTSRGVGPIQFLDFAVAGILGLGYFKGLGGHKSGKFHLPARQRDTFYFQ